MGTKVYVSQDLYTLDFVSYIHMFLYKDVFHCMFRRNYTGGVKELGVV